MLKTKSHTVAGSVFGSSLVVLSTLFYGSFGIWTRLMGSSFGPYAASWIRCSLVVVLLLPFAFFGKQTWQPIRWRADKQWFLLLLLSSLMTSGPLYYAINHAGIGLATLGMYSGTLAAMFFFGWFFNHERYTGDKFIATLLALVGLLLTSSPSFGTRQLLPLLIAVVSGLAVGLNVAVTQRIKYNSSQTAVFAWSSGVIVNVPIALLLNEHTPGLRADVHWLFLLIFTVVSVGASWSVIHGVKLIEAGAAGIIGILEVAWALFFGILFFHERPHVLAYLGAVCIIAAAVIPYIAGFKTRKAKLVEEVPR